MKLLGYIRVSTDDQARDGVSLALTQPHILNRWAAQSGHVLIDVIQDGAVDAQGKARGISAGTLFETRRGGRELLGRLDDGEADGLLVWKLERAFRDSWDALGVGRWLRRRDLHLLSATEAVDIHSRVGWLAYGLTALTAEYELGKMQDRGREVSTALRERGRVFGNTPYGCVRINRRVGDTEIKELYRDPAEWAVREEIVALRAQMSLRHLVKHLRARGIAPPGSGTGWHVSTIWNILETHDALRHLPFVAAATATDNVVRMRAPT